MYYRRMSPGFLLLTLIVTVAAAAQVVPPLINYQGRLMDSGGQPVTDPGVQMDFLVWDKDVTTESVTNETVYMTGTSPLPLAHQALVPGSEVVTAPGGAPVYSTPNDYLIDYANGTITRVSGGFILDGTTVEIDYNWADYGNLIWSETQMVSVSGGIYSVQLGAVNPFNSSLINGSTLYLEMAVAGSTLSPRQRLTSVPYAMAADLASIAANSYYLDGLDSSAFAPVNHTHDFSQITGTATDAQIPDNITINLAQNSTELNGLPSDAYVLVAGDTVTGDLQVNGNLSGLGNLKVSDDIYAISGHLGLGVNPSPSYSLWNSQGAAPSYGALLYGSNAGVTGVSSLDDTVYAELGAPDEAVVGYSGDSSSVTNKTAAYFQADSQVGATGVSISTNGYGSATAYGISSYTQNTSTGSAYAGYFLTYSSGTGTHYGLYSTSDANSSSPSYGIRAHSRNASNGLSYGGYFDVTATGTGNHYGVYAAADTYPGYFAWITDPNYNYVALAQEGEGIFSYVGHTTDTTPKYGALFYAFSSGYAAGAYASANGYGSTQTEGINANASNNSSGVAVAGLFNTSNAGTGQHYGVEASASSASSATALGSFGSAVNSSTGDAYGGYFQVASQGTGTHYGVYGISDGYGIYGANSINPFYHFGYLGGPTISVSGYSGSSADTGDRVGVASTAATSSGNSYGLRSFAYGYGTGTAYGLYAEPHSSSSAGAYAVTGFSYSTGTGPSIGGYFGAFGPGGVTYGLLVSDGTKSWANPDPDDPSKEIIYATLEGGENGTYWRGRARLQNGQAVIQLPEHFRKVTSPDYPVTAVVTPREDCNGLMVISSTNESITVKELMHGTSNAEFDFIVMGKRLGYEQYDPITENLDYVPFQGRLSGMDSSQLTTQEFYDRQTPGLKKIYEHNGTLDKSGKVNDATFQARGWKDVKAKSPRPEPGKE